MSDTTTSVLGLVKQTVGGNRNTWGGIINACWDIVEDAIVGRTEISTTGGSTTLSQTQARRQFIIVTGTLSSDATLVVPNKSKKWVIFNSTSGEFGVLVKTASGASVSIPSSSYKEVLCDGSDAVVRLDLNSIGEVFYSARTSSIPGGVLECDGSAVLRIGRYADLFAAIGTAWGPGNGSTTFNLPDAYTAGKFLRSRSGTVAPGTSQSDQNKAHAHAGSTASTTASGTADAGGGHTPTGTVGAESSHTHPHLHSTVGAKLASEFNAWTDGNGTDKPTGAGASHAHGLTMDAVANHGHNLTISASTTLSIASDGGTEARPTNLSMVLCIRY